MLADGAALGRAPLTVPATAPDAEVAGAEGVLTGDASGPAVLAGEICGGSADCKSATDVTDDTD